MDGRYFVEADDGRRYGPADLATLREWIAGARLTPSSTLIGETSGERRVAGEIAGLFGPPAVARPPLVGVTPMASPRKNRTASRLGLLVGVLGLCGLPLVAIFFPVFERVKTGSKRTIARSHIRRLGVGMVLYSGDADDRFPPRTESAIALKPFLTPYVKDEILFVTLNPNGGEILGDPRLAGRSAAAIQTPGRTVLLYDRLPWPAGDAPVSYADASAKTLRHATILSQLAAPLSSSVR